MYWGYYCRTCGISSQAWFEGPVKAVQAYYDMMPKVTALSEDEDVTLPTVQIPVVVFLSSHRGHDLWAECESGVLHLHSGPVPERHVNLPKFAGSNRALTFSRPRDLGLETLEAA